MVLKPISERDLLFRWFEEVAPCWVSLNFERLKQGRLKNIACRWWRSFACEHLFHGEDTNFKFWSFGSWKTHEQGIYQVWILGLWEQKIQIFRVVIFWTSLPHISESTNTCWRIYSDEVLRVAHWLSVGLVSYSLFHCFCVVFVFRICGRPCGWHSWCRCCSCCADPGGYWSCDALPRQVRKKRFRVFDEKSCED